MDGLAYNHDFWLHVYYWRSYQVLKQNWIAVNVGVFEYAFK